MPKKRRPRKPKPEQKSLNPEETAYLLEMMWNSPEMTSEQKLQVGDNTVTMLVHLLGKQELRAASSPWVYLINKTFEISSHVHPKKALELCMQYLQRYLEHDPEITQIAINWLDHVTAFHGLPYPEGDRLVNNVLLRFSPSEDATGVGIAAYATRVLLRWRYDSSKLLETILKSKKKANIMATALKWQPIVPGYMVMLKNTDQETYEAIYRIYHRDEDSSFVDYSILDQDDS
jgi:hypothetical protein